MRCWFGATPGTPYQGSCLHRYAAIAASVGQEVGACPLASSSQPAPKLPQPAAPKLPPSCCTGRTAGCLLFLTTLRALWLQIPAALSQGLRPKIPQVPELPGPDNNAFAQSGGLEAYVALMKRCWAQQPRERPTFTVVIQELQQLLHSCR
jgi:hypothetical protein